MRVIVHWSGGKDCCTALHRIVEQGHEVSYLVTYIYMEPYIFHSILVAELQAEALGIPHLKVKVEGDRFEGIVGELARLKKQENIEGIVTGDIDNVHHKRTWDYACKKLGMKVIMPLWDRRFFSLLPGNRYRKRIVDIELAVGFKALISCVDLNYLGEEWLGREFDRKCVDDLKPHVGPWGKGIDITGEPGEYHSTVLDAPLFRQAIEIQKVTRKRKELDFGGYPNRVGNFVYMDVEEAVLRQKSKKVNANR